ncbi:TPA: hypothetical protein DF272_05470 [Candidatus Falkowbacteria bacterium]|nr:hypothetical protein [Candidatus Falkowbacteria bacterium]
MTKANEMSFCELVNDQLSTDLEVWWEFSRRFMCCYVDSRLPEEKKSGSREMIEMMKNTRPVLYHMAIAVSQHFHVELTMAEILDGQRRAQAENEDRYARGHMVSDPRD